MQGVLLFRFHLSVYDIRVLYNHAIGIISGTLSTTYKTCFEMQGSPEVVLVSYSAFKANAPDEFRQNQNGIESLRLPDSTQVTIISDKQEFSNTPKVNLVTTVGELDAFRNQIFNRPLLLLATCGKHVPHGQR